MAKPHHKRLTWFDPKLSPQERLAGFEQLPAQIRDVLKKAGYVPGSVPTMVQEDEVIAAAQQRAAKAVVRACITALQRRDMASVNDIFKACKEADVITTGSEEPEVLWIAWRVVALLVQEMELKAFNAFRTLPSSQNYARCYGAQNALEFLGLPSSDQYPVNPWPKCFIRPPLQAGPYTVVRGDSLSKIALRFYGQANLWDAIYTTNGYNGDPDLIHPGTTLTILKSR